AGRQCCSPRVPPADSTTAISSSSRFQTVHARSFSVAGTTAASCPVGTFSTSTLGRSLRRRSTSIVLRPGRPCPWPRGINTFSGTGAASFAVSDIGTLVYLAGQGVSNEVPMVWLDRTGKTVPLRTTPADWRGARFSPDGTLLAMEIFGAGGGLPDVWIYDWMRDTPTRLTSGGINVAPIWAP